MKYEGKFEIDEKPRLYSFNYEYHLYDFLIQGRSNGFVMRGFTLKKPASNNLAVREGTASHDRHR